MRHPVVLTTVEEDFRKIGLIPDNRLQEEDDAYVPRDIPSPHPSTKAGLDDSEGDKSAHHATASQPKPSMGPDDEDDEYEATKDGGSEGAQKGKSGHKTVQGDKESSLKGENLIRHLKRQLAEAQKKIAALTEGDAEAEYEEDPKEAKIGNGKKAVMLGKKKQGEKPKPALGMDYAGKKSTASASMESTTLSRANTLIEEVQGLLRGVAVSEHSNSLVKGFNLVSENAALLADHLTGFTSQYNVGDAITVLESLSSDAAQAADIVENFGCDGDDDADDHEMHGHDKGDEHEKSADAEDENMDVYEDDEEDEDEDEQEEGFSVEHAEMAFKAMVSTLMDGLQAYDAILSEMAEDDEDDEQEEGLLGKLAGGALGAAAGGGVGHGVAGALGGALAGDIAQNRLDKPENEDDEDDADMMDMHGGDEHEMHGGEHGGEHGDEHDPEAEHAAWMHKMEKMKAMMHAMKHGGAHPFRGGEHGGEDDESMGGGY